MQKNHLALIFEEKLLVKLEKKLLQLDLKKKKINKTLQLVIVPNGYRLYTLTQRSGA
jgi:hypothetical protein